MATKSRRVNWPKLRADYIEGLPDDKDGRVWPSLRMIAELHKAAEANVRVTASSEDWVGQRAVFQARLARERQTALSTMLGESLAEIDARTILLSQKGLDAIAVFLAAASEQANDEPNANQGEQDANGSKRKKDGIDSGDLQRLAMALRGFHGVAHDAAGKPVSDPEGFEETAAAIGRDDTHQGLIDRVSTFAASLPLAAIEVSASETVAPSPD